MSISRADSPEYWNSLDAERAEREFMQLPLSDRYPAMLIMPRGHVEHLLNTQPLEVLKHGMGITSQNQQARAAQTVIGVPLTKTSDSYTPADLDKFRQYPGVTLMFYPEVRTHSELFHELVAAAPHAALIHCGASLSTQQFSDCASTYPDLARKYNPERYRNLSTNPLKISVTWASNKAKKFTKGNKR